MSMMPPPSPGAAPFAAGYTPGALPGMPTTQENQFVPGPNYFRSRHAIVLGVLGIVPLSVLAGIPAIVVGVQALREINASEGTLKGRGGAWAGIILGCLSVVMLAVFVIGTH